MIRKIGFALIIVFTLALFSLIAYSGNMVKEVFIILTVSSSALIPFGFVLISLHSKTKTAKYVHLAIASVLLTACVISIFFHLPGAGIELVVGVLWFCFAYSPLELRDKYEKWLPYSKSKFESFLLSSIDFIGITMLAIGIMFKLQRYPLANTLRFSGALILLLGLVLWNFKFKKEVVRRKEAEDKIQEQFSEIQDSINYAKRIQSAILPSDRIVKESLADSFILYKPKDIVAGDFYWLEKSSDQVLIAACDCTGHGVPGAMVSVICNNALNRSVREFGLKEPGKILDKTREIVISEFEKSEDEVKDGMDISLCSLSLSALTLYWSGANNPLWILRKDSTEIEEIKADKQPIGKYAAAKSFTTHQKNLEKGDLIYLITDGYQDQFGGDKGKKFKAAELKNLLVSISKETMESQKKKIDEAFETWRGKLEQIDDVCIIGIRV
jgi:serine phosphatase RsbU (regulator of sigma subunit)